MRIDETIGQSGRRHLQVLPPRSDDHLVRSGKAMEPVSVVIPVLNEAQTIGRLVRLLQNEPRVLEVLVVDDGSTDATPEIARRAGASVLMSSYQGRGASMEDGLNATRGDVVLCLDGSLSDIREDLVENMTRPILVDGADLVKARLARGPGRVTTLTARPLVDTFFPEVAGFAQLLGGLIAVRRSLLANIRLENDHGVDVGLLIDAVMKGAKVVEVDIGQVDSEVHSLEALGEMAKQVTRVILDRAWKHGRLCINQLREIEERERRTSAGLAPIAPDTVNEQKYALFGMNGVLLDGRFITNLADRVGARSELARFLDNEALPRADRARHIAALFTSVSKDIFEDVARSIPLMEGAAETVIALRSAGYRVGIVSDGFLVATEVVRRRVFADFCIGHVLRFRNGFATGELTPAPAFMDPEGCPRHHSCKANVLCYLSAAGGLDLNRTIAVGNGLSDICLLREVGLSVAFRPTSRLVSKAAQHTLERSLLDILDLVLPPKRPIPIRSRPKDRAHSEGDGFAVGGTAG